MLANNAGALTAAAARTGWRPLVVDRSLRSGILLLEAENAEVQPALPDLLRSKFQRRGLALTAYPNGVIRISLPSAPWEDADLDQIRSALRGCS